MKSMSSFGVVLAATALMTGTAAAQQAAPAPASLPTSNAPAFSAAVPARSGLMINGRQVLISKRMAAGKQSVAAQKQKLLQAGAVRRAAASEKPAEPK